jgi:glutamate 5-kinase
MRETVLHEDRPRTGSPERAAVAAARRVVVKIGTRVLCDEDGEPQRERLSQLVATVAGMRGAGREVILVSSGAVGVGRSVLGRAATKAGPKEACAAVGQSFLIALYQRTFAAHGMACGQLLLGQRDLHQRGRSVRLMRTLDELLRGGVVPVLNENDATGGDGPLASVHGPSSVFSDNDRLAALVAGAMGAQLLVFLTDVDGVFESVPRPGAAAAPLSRIDGAGQLPAIGRARGGGAGSGGMRSKVEAALIASRGGCDAVIGSGRDPGAFSRLVAGEVVGTWFPAGGRLAARERWIAFAAAPRGVLHLDAGAVRALAAGTASLLGAGVTAVEGSFLAGEVVELRGPDGRLVGRALSKLGADATREGSGSGSGRPGMRSAPLVRHANIVLEPLAAWGIEA